MSNAHLTEATYIYGQNSWVFMVIDKPMKNLSPLSFACLPASLAQTLCELAAAVAPAPTHIDSCTAPPFLSDGCNTQGQPYLGANGAAAPGLQQPGGHLDTFDAYTIRPGPAAAEFSLSDGERTTTSSHFDGTQSSFCCCHFTDLTRKSKRVRSREARVARRHSSPQASKPAGPPLVDSPQAPPPQLLHLQ
jgi:hypothetical protein